MELLRHYKYLIKPNLDQKKIIIKTFGAVRFVHNRIIDDKRNGKFISGRAVSILERYRRQYPFLKDADGSALINEIFQAQDSIRHLARYKSRKDSFASYTTANLPRSPIKVLPAGFLLLPKLGTVKMVYHRTLPENAVIKKATVMRLPDGKYYVSICISFIVEKVTVVPDVDKTVGIDYSSAHFFVDSNGVRVDMPHYFRKMQNRLTKERKKLQSMLPESKNYYQQKMKLASLNCRVKDQRKDFLHKLSTEMVEKYDIICMEDLDMKGIAQSYNLGKSTYDNAFGMFRKMLDYKMKEKGKILMLADRYYPSSKTCHVCGFVNRNLQLSDRKWICPHCHSLLERDENAAINIRNHCLNKYISRRISG